jgi:hypothetical protein
VELKHIRYVQNVLLGFDEFANTLIGGAPGDTISGRSGRAAKDGRVWGRVLCYLLGLIDKDHCTKAIANDAA